MRQAILLFFCITAICFGQSSQSAAPLTRNVNRGNPAEEAGTLVVLVTWGDVDNTPATNVVVEAVGHAPDRWGKMLPVKASKNGRYEALLDPGIYDVFVSESGSMPRCRRVWITPKSTMYWTLKLEIDDVYQRGDVF